MTSRYGDGRHRQPWIEAQCPHCGLMAAARKTGPRKPLHIKTHFDGDGFLCPPLSAGASTGTLTMVRPPGERAKQWPGQGRLFEAS